MTSPALAQSQDEPTRTSYITVDVSDDNSDPASAAVSLSVTWYDAGTCSAGYKAYLRSFSGINYLTYPRIDDPQAASFLVRLRRKALKSLAL